MFILVHVEEKEKKSTSMFVRVTLSGKFCKKGQKKKVSVVITKKKREDVTGLGKSKKIMSKSVLPKYLFFSFFTK